MGENDLMTLEGDGIYFTDGCATEGGDVIVVTAYDYPGDVWKEVRECVDVGKTVTEEKDDLGIAVHIKRFTHKERRAVGIGKNENFQVADSCFHNKAGECIQWLQINEEGERSMQINREMLAKMAAMNDAELWESIRAVGESYGYSLATRQPTHGELEKIRSLLRGDVQISPMDAMRLLNQYKDKDRG